MKKKINGVTTTAGEPVTIVRDIPLEDWAVINKVKPRTAKDWAKKGYIKAKLKPVKIVVTTEREQLKYHVRSNTKKPTFGK